MTTRKKPKSGGRQVEKKKKWNEYEIVDTQARNHSHHDEVKANYCSILNISEDIKGRAELSHQSLFAMSVKL